ncbi:MAG: hypothetical protein JXQ79_06055 [Rhodobacteraceae bacterium]|nr:hypothetical protein [Paracoccaceae bacterium]
MHRNHGFTKTPAQPAPQPMPQPGADLGRMAQGWGEYNAKIRRAARRDRAYRWAAIALVAIIAGMLLAMIASNAWAQAQADAALAPSIMRF